MSTRQSTTWLRRGSEPVLRPPRVETHPAYSGELSKRSSTGTTLPDSRLRAFFVRSPLNGPCRNAETPVSLRDIERLQTTREHRPRNPRASPTFDAPVPRLSAISFGEIPLLQSRSSTIPRTNGQQHRQVSLEAMRRIESPSLRTGGLALCHEGRDPFLVGALRRRPFHVQLATDPTAKQKRSAQVWAEIRHHKLPGGLIDGSFVTITAVNTGHRDVALAAFSLAGPQGALMPMVARVRPAGFENTPLPVTLADGQQALHHFELDAVVGQSLNKGTRRDRHRDTDMLRYSWQHLSRRTVVDRPGRGFMGVSANH